MFLSFSFYGSIIPQPPKIRNGKNKLKRFPAWGGHAGNRGLLNYQAFFCGVYGEGGIGGNIPTEDPFGNEGLYRVLEETA